jgi:alpha-galactosidase
VRVSSLYLAAVVIMLFALASLPTRAQDVALTPPMGWNYFAEKVDDLGVRAAADAIVANGMKDAGYVYVNIDDTWEGHRDSNGVLQANSKFPDMKALADYVHSKGLKIGIYSSPGPKTCADYEGSSRLFRPRRPGRAALCLLGYRLSQV